LRLFLHGKRVDAPQLFHLRVERVLVLRQTRQLIVPGTADFLPLFLGVFAHRGAQLGFLARLALLRFLRGDLIESGGERVDGLLELSRALGELGRHIAKTNLVVRLDALIDRFGCGRALCLERRQPLLVSLALLEEAVERVQRNRLLLTHRELIP
jgi:hypothetical protein